MLRKCFKSTGLALAVVLATPCAPSQAATGVGSISVGTNVLSLCLVSGSTIAFGTYNTAAQLDQTGTITVLCTFGTSYNVGLDAGSGAGATTTVRKMTGLGGDTLHYALYRNAARSSLWGSTVGADTVAGTANGLLQSLTVYGRIPSGQAPKADLYSDTVTITLTY
ncbi:spore coat U domain-containing protein [Herbaspirillum sp. WKF16]|jgi:spore coat protein U-like protein|uniref:Csu type fimbrial protein n=1 Tax=Herbaspirillum sp. WKF16 TaxID=3028312 RepID=UPI0023A9BD61|nr:spore coat U domain-containing protein [Herbaspirillum sp. WKF16]WDZ94198.1 spore coat U domain-containing protein [Herbaspirillum sp. WKF16]